MRRWPRPLTIIRHIVDQITGSLLKHKRSVGGTSVSALVIALVVWLGVNAFVLVAALWGYRRATKRVEFLSPEGELTGGPTTAQNAEGRL
jgi:hypothetical protein